MTQTERVDDQRWVDSLGSVELVWAQLDLSQIDDSAEHNDAADYSTHRRETQGQGSTRLSHKVDLLSSELRSGTKTPAKPTMIKLYESLNQLESLTLRGGLIDLILEHDVASTCFPQLSMLELNHPLQRSSNTLDVRRFACIAHYAKVTSLTVTIPFYGEEYEDESGDEDKAEKMMEAGAEAEREAVGHSGHETDLKYVASEGNGSITHLHLTTPCDDPRTHQFVEAFKSITHLTLIDPNLKDPNFTPFLSSYDRAPSIQSLHLRTEIGNFFITDLSHRDISLSLRRFTSLQSLILDTFTYTSTIFQYLRDPLPLKSLTLNRNGLGISTRDLKALFAPGPTRLSSLKTLVINTIYPGKIGTRAGSGDDYTINSRGLPPGSWTLPVWDEESFDAQGARELVQIAKEVGVKVEGTVIEALETEMAWKVDIEVAEELEGMEWEESGAWRDEEGWRGNDSVGSEDYE